MGLMKIDESIDNAVGWLDEAIKEISDLGDDVS